MYIQHLHLHTPVFDEQFHFYTAILGMPLEHKNIASFTVAVGESRITFHKASSENYYHFAFNIPSFQSQEALAWLKERVEILTDDGEEVIDFSNWNAETIYFKDPGGNIVEFIARKNLKVESDQPFSVQSLSCISEIGVPVQNVEETFRHLNDTTGKGTHQPLAKYWTAGAEFLAAGDENGLFIIVDEATKDWYPTEIPARAFPLEVIFKVEGESFRLFLNAEQIYVEQAAANNSPS